MESSHQNFFSQDQLDFNIQKQMESSHQNFFSQDQLDFNIQKQMESSHQNFLSQEQLDFDCRNGEFEFSVQNPDSFEEEAQDQISIEEESLKEALIGEKAEDEVFVEEESSTKAQILKEESMIPQKNQDLKLFGSQNSETYQGNSIQKDQKTKKIERPYLSRRRRPKIPKKKDKPNVNDYPTKNMLAWAKPIHFNYLGQITLSDDLEKIRQKKAISMQDYELLYKEKDLEQVWKRFFNTRVLYRKLMISKLTPKMRTIYLNKVKRFNEAFIERKFDRTNGTGLPKKPRGGRKGPKIRHQAQNACGDMNSD